MITVVGATGRQGGAVLRRLLANGTPVRALTRDPRSSAAVALAAKGAEVVRADLDSRASLEAALRGSRAVFGVTEFWEHGLAGEIRQGRNLVDAAASAGVEHFVFSSVGGTDRTAELGIAHFDSKREIERLLCASGLSWTVLRPVTFFENFTSGRYRRAIRSGLFQFAIRPGLPFQLVALDDLAALAVKALAEPQAFARRAIEVASDRLTMEELCEALSAAVGRPVRYRFLGPVVQRLVALFVEVTRTSGHFKVGKSLIRQFSWNNDSPIGGWDADLDQLGRWIPLTSAAQWARSVDWGAGEPRVAVRRAG